MPKLQDIDIAKARKLYDEGLSMRSIAERCNTNRDVIRRLATMWPERKRANREPTRGAAAVANAVGDLERRKRTEQQIIGRASVAATTNRTLPPLLIESLPILTFDTDHHV